MRPQSISAPRDLSRTRTAKRATVDRRQARAMKYAAQGRKVAR